MSNRYDEFSWLENASPGDLVEVHFTEQTGGGPCTSNPTARLVRKDGDHWITDQGAWLNWRTGVFSGGAFCAKKPGLLRRILGR